MWRHLQAATLRLFHCTFAVLLLIAWSAFLCSVLSSFFISMQVIKYIFCVNMIYSVPLAACLTAFLQTHHGRVTPDVIRRETKQN